MEIEVDRGIVISCAGFGRLILELEDEPNAIIIRIVEDGR